ncbi:hypothetical protein G6F56_013807 [Rhizopus delemar]|nr:hypothetical protein G6F56_013807 [Rhizopus delemar]
MGSVTSQQRNGQSITQNNKPINEQNQQNTRIQKNLQNEQNNLQLNVLLTQEDLTDIELCAAIRPNYPTGVTPAPYVLPTQLDKGKQPDKPSGPKKNVTTMAERLG